MSRNLSRRLLAAIICVLVAGPALAQMPDREVVREMKQNPAEFVNVVHGYLSMVGEMRQVMQDPVSAILMAHHDLRDLYDRKGDKVAAIEEFKKTLKQLKDPAARTAVRFALSDLYRETGHMDKAVAELRMIITENIRRLEAEAQEKK